MVVRAQLINNRIIAQGSDPARELYNSSRYGKIYADGAVHFSLYEGLYLVEKKKIEVFFRSKRLDTLEIIKKASRLEKNFMTRYQVFADLRTRGYVVKTALKFGAEFRVYDRGVKPGEDHAKWIVYPIDEAETLTWYEFSAKNRVAHSTKKRLMLGIVDAEGDVSYFEIRWMKP